MIDSHQHFWKYDPQKFSWITEEMMMIRKDFLPADLAPVLKENGFDGCVAVQADSTHEETLFLLSLAEKFDFVKGVVGWVDFTAPDLDDQLQHYRTFPKLKGFRHIAQAEPRGFLVHPEFVAGVRRLASQNFTYDLLVYHHQLDDALAFVASVEEVPVVVDHLAKPSIRTREKTHWELQMASLSTFQNVYCKLSGMVTEANWHHWKYEDFVPYLDELMETFGPDRLMYGSDWPVCLVAASYEEQLSIVQQYIATLSPSEKERIMGGNAERFYNL